ncbi:HupE/UreJ family protein [Rudaea sp.]|uniref:HupE/UreJ family protein n=1 Tax=Rudaea sp. TaxID=2136325 RepID=UPI00321F7B69
MPALAGMLALAAVSTPALAHPGHGAGGGLLAGFVHPFSGFDHFLAMIAVGVWAAQLGGRAVWAVPAAFMALMALGAVLVLSAAGSFAAGGIESGVAASLLVLGLLVWRAQRMPLSAAAALVAWFGLFHGAAHGGELPQFADPLRYALGFLVATALLHGAGVVVGVLLKRHAPLLGDLAGAATAAAGIVLLLGVR